MRTVPGTPEAEEIVRTILGLGENLRVNVVAEGVETEQQAQFLATAGCRFAQGYFYAKPAPPQLVADLLRNQLSQHKGHQS